MQKRKTDLQVFLEWCKKNKVKPRKIKRDSDSSSYHLPFTLTIGLHTFKRIEQCQTTNWPEVYFDEKGEWYGGDAEIWFKVFPWVGRKHKKDEQ